MMLDLKHVEIEVNQIQWQSVILWIKEVIAVFKATSNSNLRYRKCLMEQMDLKVMQLLEAKDLQKGTFSNICQ